MRRLISIGMWIYVLMLILSLGGMSTPIVSAQSPTPYIYYYHPDLNAWVIERADGTDSRLLEQSVSKNTNTADGEWSSSGEWFAWLGRFYSGEPTTGNPHLYAMRADGSAAHAINSPFSVNHQFNNVSLIQWAANEDHIFVREDVDGSSYFLVDAATEKVIWSKVITYDRQMIMGELVGDYFVYWNFNETDKGKIENSISLLSLTTGETFKLPKDSSEREDYKRLVNSALVSKPYLVVSMRDKSGLSILDVVNGDLFEIDTQVLPFPPTYQSLQGHLQWSSDGQYALLTVSRICPNVSKECFDIWLLSLEQRVLQHVGDNLILSDSFWLTNEPIAIFTTEAGVVSIFDARSGSVNPIIGTKASLMFRWAAAGEKLFSANDQDLKTFDVSNISDARLLIQLHLPLDRYYRVDEFRPNNLYASPDNRYIGLGNAQAIYDFNDNSVFLIPPHSGATYGDRKYAYYSWDASSQWLITGQATSYMDGGGQLRNMIFHVDGNDRRELNTGDQPKWLPTNVIAHLPLAQSDNVLPQPYLTLEHHDLVTVAQWNQANDRLVVVSGTQLYIWSFELAEPQVEKVIGLEKSCGGYEGGVCSINWSPDEHSVAVSGFYKDDYMSTYYILIDLQTGQITEKSDKPFMRDEIGHLIAGANSDPIDPELSAELDKVRGKFDQYVISLNHHWAVTESIYKPSKVYRFGLNKEPVSLNWYAKSISFTPDDCWLTASNSWLVTIWKLSDLIPDGASETATCKPLVKGTYKVKPS